MKRLAVIVCALALVLTGCADEKGIGGDFGPLDSPPPSTKTAKPKAKAKAKATKKSTPKPTRKARSYEPETYKIVINNTYDQYEPREISHALRPGDKVIFTNKDPNNKHSLTEGRTSEESDPKFDSGVLSNGQSKTIEIKAAWAPGTYYYHCSVVPYIQNQGPFRVIK